MPRSFDEVSTGDVELVFPDDAAGKTYRLEEQAVYEAGEVRDEAGTDDVPKYGDWLRVEVGGREAWLNAPSALLSEVASRDGSNVSSGEQFTVDRLTKTGHGESDPYRAEISFPGDREQDRLEDQAEAAGDD